MESRDVRIAEIYRSIQGEGLLTGTPSVFIRASGCNLRCWFCDTPHASWKPEGHDLSVDRIVARVARFRTEHVVLTGGEPMLFAELIPLCERLTRRGHHLTVETAGTLYLPLVCDLMSISPKLSNATPSAKTAPKWRARHDRTRQQPEVVRRLIREYRYQLKFVIDAPADVEEVEQYLADLPGVDRSNVLLMPQGTEPGRLAEIGRWLEPYCRQHNLRFCPRKHIEWFGLVRGT
jgi:7-carboxy-7-deazaguanine synthase